MKSPCSKSIQVELGKVEGFWSVLQLLQQALAKNLDVEQQVHWLLPADMKINQSASASEYWCNYVRLSKNLMAYLEFYNRTLDLFNWKQHQMWTLSQIILKNVFHSKM